MCICKKQKQIQFYAERKNKKKHSYGDENGSTYFSIKNNVKQKNMWILKLILIKKKKKHLNKLKIIVL